MGGAPTVQSVPQWLAQNVASGSGMSVNESDVGEEPAEMDQDEEDEVRPFKRTRVDEDQHVLVSYCLF